MFREWSFVTTCCCPEAFLRKQSWDLYCLLFLLTTSQIVFPIVCLVCMQMTLASNHIHCIGLYLNHDLINISDWLIGYNKLALNTSKIELLIGSRQRFKTLETAHLYRLIYGASIKQVSYAISLGVLIDEILSWNKHIEK